MAWYADEPSSIDASHSIPSRSWAAVEANISSYYSFSSPESETKPLVSILEAATTSVDDPYGEVNGGTIRMRCPLPFVATLQANFRPDWLLVNSHNHRLCYCRLYPDKVPYAAGAEIYVIPIIRGINWSKEDTICGLIIEPVQPASYRRVGLFYARGDHGTNFRKTLEAQKEASYEDEYFIGEALGPNENG